MKMRSVAACLVAASSALYAGTEQVAMHEVAKTSVRPAGAPDYADVCFRYGWIRGSGHASVENAKKAMRGFHATRVDWFYPGTHTADDGGKYVNASAKAFIDWCHARDMKVGGAINNNTKKPEWKYKKHHLDRYVGEPSNPDFIADVLAWGKAQIDAGVDTMVCDDIFKYDAPRQKIWSEKVLAELKAYKPGFTIAGNSGHSIGTDYVKRYAVDFHYSDNNFVPSPAKWWSAMKAHRALNSAVLLHPNRHISKATRRQMIALGYANGAHVITPWDEYIHGKERLFADPADFADVYAFARALGQRGLLNGYEDAAVGGFDLKETRYGSAGPVSVAGGSGKLSVFARAMPGQADAPLVVHLVDSGSPAPCTVNLRRSALFGDREVKVSLLTPLAYGAELHEKAAESGDFSKLLQANALPSVIDGEWIGVAVPAVAPWAVLLLEVQK